MKKAIVFKILRYSGLPFLFRELTQRSKVTIVLFHDLSMEKAEKTLEYLQRHYNIIHLRTFVEACRASGTTLPPKSLVLTLDDGHIGNWNLLSLVREKRIPVTIFLCAGMIGTNRHFWCRKCSPGHTLSQLLQVSNAEKLRLLRSTGFVQDREYEEPQVLTKSQINEMKPYFDFQAHTLFHPSLPRCSHEEAKHEISQCKDILENELGLRIYALSYPHGAYSDRDIALCREAGYACGVTADYGCNTTRADLFRLKRIPIEDAAGIDELAVTASGLRGFLRKMAGASRRARLRDEYRRRRVHAVGGPV
jgi:peptidoglycan/xylan/chitin deacetylase (PgdA/CDA1 family)